MADIPYDYRFVPTANHTNLSNSALPDVRSLSLQAYPPLQRQSKSIVHLGYSAGAQRFPHMDSTFVPTLEFRVPLLPQNVHLVPDFQPRAVTVASDVSSWRRTRYDYHGTDHPKKKGLLGEGAASATLSFPPSVPLTLPTAVPFPSPSPFGRTTPVSSDVHLPERPATPCMEGIVSNLETPSMRYEDMYRMGSPSDEELAHSLTFYGRDSPDVRELALSPGPPYPPPVFAQNSPNLLAPYCPDSPNKDMHSVDLATLPMHPWSPPYLTLPSLSDDSLSSPENSLRMSVDDPSFGDELRLSLSPPPFASKMDCDEPGSPPMFGIIVDVNMREHAMQELSPEFYVNPADVMARFLRSANPSPELTPKLDDEDCDMATLLRSESVCAFAEPAGTSTAASTRQMSPVPDYAADFPDDAVIHQDFPDEAISAIVSVLKSATTSATAQGTCAASPSATISLPSQAFTQSSEVVAPRPVYASPGHHYPGSDLGMLRSTLADSSGGLGFPGPNNPSGSRLPLGELRVPQQYTAPTYVPYPPAAFPGAPTYAFPSAPVPQQGHAQSQFMDVPQPVLNAHVGITLEELRQRATEYRARHPSAELDKAFLQSFAGRLSSRGELLDDYRCYVVGCGQRNKRRDHILVHVGSHVEHRPWACQHCGMKFLRKNECKRHESSHEGRKPYSCEICAPFQERSFVRQDLLKRHLRVSHGVHGTARKKSANKGEDQDYWP